MIQVVGCRSLIAKTRFQNRVVNLRFVMDQEALGQSPPPPSPKDIGRLHAILFHYCSIPFFHLNASLIRTDGRSLENFKESTAFSYIGEHRIGKLFSLLFSVFKELHYLLQRVGTVPGPCPKKLTSELDGPVRCFPAHRAR
jgi:hypothetical protein